MTRARCSIFLYLKKPINMPDKLVEILLVEDREEDAILAIKHLKKYNIANYIKWVDDGEKALNYLFGNETTDRSALPKVILLDLKMPKVDGLEVLQQIKTNAVLRKIPVVVLTSSKEEPDIETAYDLGANSYIVKPVDFQKFAERIKDIGMYWAVMNEAPVKNNRK